MREVRGLHVVGIAAKRQVAPAGIGESAVVRRKPPRPGGAIADVHGGERSGQRLGVELRVVPRARHRAHVDQLRNEVGAKQLHERLDRPRRMADRQDATLAAVPVRRLAGSGRGRLALCRRAPSTPRRFSRRRACGRDAAARARAHRGTRGRSDFGTRADGDADRLRVHNIATVRDRGRAPQSTGSIPRRSRIARPTRSRSSSLNSRAAIGSSSLSSRLMCRSYKPTRASTSFGLERSAVSSDNALEYGTYVLPARFEFAALGCQACSQLAHAYRIRAGHRLDERREEVFFLVGMMVQRRCIEVAHHVSRRGARLGVCAVAGQVRHEAPQRGALALDARMARREHLQRHFEAGRWWGMAWNADAHARDAGRAASTAPCAWSPMPGTAKPSFTDCSSSR